MMKNLVIILFLGFFCNHLFAEVSIVPMPLKCIEKKGCFEINRNTVIVLPMEDDEMQHAVSFWNELFKDAAGYELKFSSVSRKTNAIYCRMDKKLPEEGYRIWVRSSGIRIDVRSPKGFFYALQTLRQLLPKEIENSEVQELVRWKIPCVEIEDAPQFSYRGMMLDVSRHFIPKNDLKHHIDLMAFHKLNVLHWHLTDDQGWRIEIKKYPKLTNIGAWRKKTIEGYMWDNPTEWNTKRYGGYYSQEDVREIVEYARKRFVEIIPEIEMPGHSVAALAAYPQYACSGGPFEVEGRWGVFNDIYCTKESTFLFLQDILDEVIDLFPSSYIHLGGDEAPRIRWKNCVHCQKRMEQELLKDESALQTYFMNRIEAYLNTKGKKIIGWDEILEGGIPSRATVMSWRGEKGGIQAAKAGYDVIMSPNIYMYFNCIQSKPVEKKIGNPNRLITLEKVYNYHPVPKELTWKESQYIKGVQANLWTEYIYTLDEMEYMLYPRVAALSEVAWSKPDKKDYVGFCRRLEGVTKHYDVLGIDYCKVELEQVLKNKQKVCCSGAVDLEVMQHGESIFPSGFSAFSLKDHFVWCGSAIRAKEDGRYYLFYSAMESGNEHPRFVDAWLLGSKIGVAVSDSPYGGYRDLGFVYNRDGYERDDSSWDAQTVSNTHIQFFNGKYYLYYCGSVNVRENVYVKGKLSRRDAIQQNQKLGVLCFNSIAELLAGKFTCNEQPLLVPRTRVKADNVLEPSPEGTVAKPDNLIMVNPSIVYHPVKKKYFLYFKGNIYDPFWRGVHGVAIADTPNGPFKVLDDYVFEFPVGKDEKLNAEDPFVWYHRQDECFYAVFKDFTGRFTKGRPGLAIMYSRDGLHWELPEESLFMSKELLLKNGKRLEVDRLERPQLLLDENDDPIVLYAACSITPLNMKRDGSSFNVQIPVTFSSSYSHRGLKLMSYNIRNGNGMDNVCSVQRIADIISRERPDVVAVQEVDSMTHRSGQVYVLGAIAEKVGMNACFASAIDYDGGKYGIGILSRKQPLALERYVLPGGEEKRALIMAEFEDYVFCCTHLSLIEEDRLKALEVIRNKLKGCKKPLFLAGDFNDTPESNFGRALQKDFVILSDPKCPTIPASKPQETIDYITAWKPTFKGTYIQSSMVPQDSVASDHRPVVVELLFPRYGDKQGNIYNPWYSGGYND